MKIATLNTASLVAQKRKKWLEEIITREDIDIICLQETKISSLEEQQLFVNYFSDSYWCHHSAGVGRSAGTCNLIRKTGAVSQVIDCYLDQGGRIAVSDCIIQNEIVRVISVYSPNEVGERADFFNSLRTFVDVPNKVFLCGDFNCVERCCDCTYPVPKAEKSVCELKRLLNDFDLEDVTSRTGITGLRYTHWQGRSHARLDRIYISGEWRFRTESYHVAPLPFTDHSLVLYSCSEGRRPEHRSQALWKLNESLLEEDDFVQHITNMLNVFESGPLTAVTWEIFKQNLKDYAIGYGRARARLRREELTHLSRTLHQLLVEDSNFPGTLRVEIEDTKHEILRRLDEKFKGAAIRSREVMIARDEQPVKVFLMKERKRALDNKIEAVYKDGTLYEGEDQVQRAFSEVYSEMFSGSFRPDAQLAEELISLVPKVNEDTRELVNNVITQEDVLLAINKLAENKAPGPDGIGSSFYKTFATRLAPLLAVVFDDIHKRGLLPPSMRKAHTVLIRKRKSVVRPSVKDFRPISLLCTDYKILAKIISRRTSIALRETIGKHQVYGFPGRKISRNLHIMRTVCEIAQVHGSPLGIVQVDLSQAFDRVSHQFLFDLLKWCQLGEYLERWILAFYRGMNTHLVVNNSRGCRIDIRSSVRQGCPLSPLLFSLYLEPLCRKLISNTNLTGAVMGTEVIKICAYADDLTVICSSKEQVTEALKDINRFTMASGAKINLEKSEGAWLGSWESTPATFLGMSWSTRIVKYLGVPLDLQQRTSEIWSPKLNSLRGSLISWRGRQISLLNKAFLCNSVSYPAALYWAQCLSCDATTIHKIHREWATFIWSSPFERMRRTNLFLAPEQGGFGLVNLMLKIKIQRLRYFRSQKDPFLRAALQELGAGFLARWVVTSAKAAPKVQTLRFYKEIEGSLKFFEDRYSWDYLVNTNAKQIYWETLSSLLPCPLYRTPPVAEAGVDVLKRVKSLPISTASKDFFTRLHCEILPVKCWLRAKGFFVPWSLKCPFCDDDETLVHVFVLCKGALFFWADLRNHLGSDFEVDWTAARFLTVNARILDKLTAVLVVLGLHAMWRARTDYVQCKPDLKAAWWHFRTKFKWTLNAVKAIEVEKEGWRELELKILGVDSNILV